MNDLFSDQLIDGSFDFQGVWLIVWCYEWKTDWLIEWLTVSVIDWLTDLLIGWLTGWLMIRHQWTKQELANRLTYIWINWLIEWLTDWLIDWLIYTPCEKSVLITLLKFTLAIILLPISCLFLSKKIFFEGNHIIFGTKSTEVFLNFPFQFQDFNQGSKLKLANWQNASDFVNLQVRKISTSKHLLARIIHVSQTCSREVVVVRTTTKETKHLPPFL